ncbi:hypothetical protein [Pseudomonas sp. HS-18]|uniref:hypothetical protein n=1 Tax=Pseudomonas sp. HS-18 TaxID=2879114 RepID=UPI001CEFED51|nr:hypothetical protein [Pseudomonas sp. HS-18]UCL90283.1 hypothetical protein LDJ84_30380 [Pseudomonas sp. HS-18]
MYHHYKPLRNLMQKLEIQRSLIALWHYSENIDHGRALSYEFSKINPTGRASLEGVVHPWELDILAREVVLNAGDVSRDGKDLYKIGSVAAAVNLIRSIHGKQTSIAPGNDLLHELHRLAQQQFPWQAPVQIKLSRLLRIFRDEDLNKLLVLRTGLSVSHYYLMGIAMAGTLMRQPYLDLKQSYASVGVGDTLRDIFFAKVMYPLDSLRERTREVQEYNGNWSYTINPLRKTPMVILPNNPNIAFCPIPRFLLERISDGLYYDITEVPGFENIYGSAYENYVGEIASELSSKRLVVEKLAPYKVGKSRKDGSDWAVSDSDAVLLVESKAKRLNLRAKYELDTTAVDEEMSKLAKFIVQNYKNLLDIKSGLTGYSVNGRKIFPVIVTLTEWHLCNPNARGVLEQKVIQRLIDAALPEYLLTEHPFTVMSIDEFETAIQVMSEVGIVQVMGKKCDSEHIDWQMAPFLFSKYKEQTDRASGTYLNSELDRVISDAERYVSSTQA